MEERARVSPSEITRPTRPTEREDIPETRKPAPQQSEDTPDWAKTTEMLDPRELERQVDQKRAIDPDYLMATVTSGTGGVKIPEDIYDVDLIRIEPVEIKGNSKYAKEKEDPNALQKCWEWYFRICDSDPDYKGTSLRCLSSRSMHEQSKPYRWYGDIAGKSPASGEKIDLKNLFGKRCRIRVKFNKDGYSVIDDVMKVSTRASSAQ